MGVDWTYGSKFRAVDMTRDEVPNDCGIRFAEEE
jgi:hypothetical protein